MGCLQLIGNKEQFAYVLHDVIKCYRNLLKSIIIKLVITPINEKGCYI